MHMICGMADGLAYLINQINSLPFFRLLVSSFSINRGIIMSNILPNDSTNKSDQNLHERNA